jgi:hypothetical protein
MEDAREKQEIERWLARCRELMAAYRDGLTAKNLRDLERELLARLQRFR